MEETNLILGFLVLLVVVVAIGYWSHRRWTLKNTGSTKMVTGSVWGAVKLVGGVIAVLLVLRVFGII